MGKRVTPTMIPDEKLLEMTDDQTANEWRRWMVEIRSQIWMLQLDDYLYQGTLAVAEANPNILGHILTARVESGLYANVLLVIRRLTDNDKDVISFQGLFRQILHSLDVGRQILSRARFVTLYDKGHFTRPGRSSDANSLFDNLIGTGKDFLDKGDVGRDRTDLIQAYDKLSSFINDVLCHYNEQTMKELRPGVVPNPLSYDYPTLPPYTDVQSALACLERLLGKYWCLLYADDDYKFPVMASNPWEIFKTPWIAGTEPQIPPSPDVLVRGVSCSQDPKVTNKKQSGKVDNAYLICH
jgi:hypothetical protein